VLDCLTATSARQAEVVTKSSRAGPDVCAAHPDAERFVVVAGCMDPRDQVPELRWQLCDAALKGARSIVVDMAGVEELSSAMASTLLTSYRLCRVRGGQLELVNCERDVVELLAHTSLWRIFGVAERVGTLEG
jgi:anti-anti-sigma factor